MDGVGALRQQPGPVKRSAGGRLQVDPHRTIQQPGLQLRTQPPLRVQQSAGQSHRNRFGEAGARDRGPGRGHEGTHRLSKQVAGDRVTRSGCAYDVAGEACGLPGRVRVAADQDRQVSDGTEARQSRLAQRGLWAAPVFCPQHRPQAREAEPGATAVVAQPRPAPVNPREGAIATDADGDRAGTDSEHHPGLSREGAGMR